MMLLTSSACLASQRAKLRSRGSGASRRSSTAVQHAPHCCTASRQALQACAAPHKTRGSELSAGCAKAMDNAAGSLTAASFGHHQEQQQRNMLVLKPCKIQAVPMHAHVPATKRKGMEEKVSHIASPCPS
jgi:hypothetical protein